MGQSLVGYGYLPPVSLDPTPAPSRRGPALTAALAAALLVLAQACRDEPADTPAAPTPPPAEEVRRVNLPVPAFSADSAYAHVARQVGFGPRVPNSEAHAAARDYFRRTLERYGLDVTVQEFPARFFDGARATGYNIVASVNPAATRRVFLSAHYDTRPFADSELEDEPARRDEPIDGADDGASGAGVLLEVARLLGEDPPADLGVDLVFFDAEDYGKPDGKTQDDVYTWGLGSQHWARQPHVAGYAPEWGILLDMVGAEGAVFGRELYSRQYAGGLQNKIWALARRMGRGERFVDAQVGAVTDDHFFVNTIAGWPTVDIIYKPVSGDPSFGAHWHTHDDDLDVISTETLGDVGQVVTAVVYKAAGNVL